MLAESASWRACVYALTNFCIKNDLTNSTNVETKFILACQTLSTRLRALVVVQVIGA